MALLINLGNSLGVVDRSDIVWLDVDRYVDLWESMVGLRFPRLLKARDSSETETSMSYCLVRSP